MQGSHRLLSLLTLSLLLSVPLLLRFLSLWVLLVRGNDKDIWRPMHGGRGEGGSLKVVFGAPATHWTDAVPIGNGRVGAMIWGGVGNETIQLNEDTLWTGVPGNYINPDPPAALSTVRKLVSVGRYPEVTTEAVKLSGQWSDVYQLLGNIKLEFEFDDSHLSYDADTYKRELDLDSAMVTVKYDVGNVSHTREHFTSYPDQVVAVKISASRPGSVSFKLSLDSKLSHHTYASGKNKIIMEGSCLGRWTDEPKGIQFTAVLSLQVGKGKGNIEIGNDNKAVVNESDWAVILLVASSSFGGPFVKPSDTTWNPTTESFKLIGSVETLPYSVLYARHLKDYRKLFHLVLLRLSKSFGHRKGPEVATAERVKSFQVDEDPSLVELLFQYGRYLLISCSRPGTQVANLQGIWNKELWQLSHRRVKVAKKGHGIIKP